MSLSVPVTYMSVPLPKVLYDTIDYAMTKSTNYMAYDTVLYELKNWLKANYNWQHLNFDIFIRWTALSWQNTSYSLWLSFDNGKLFPYVLRYDHMYKLYEKTQPTLSQRIAELTE